MNPITGRSVYRCQMDLDPINVKEVNKMLPKSIDFGLARKLDSGNLFVETIGIYPIQPNHYCDPEVILCYGWDFSVDFWKLGVLIRHLNFSGVFNGARQRLEH